MSGHHPWNKLFEETFPPEKRAQIIRDADKLVVDNPVERTRRARVNRAKPHDPQQAGTTTSTR